MNVHDAPDRIRGEKKEKKKEKNERRNRNAIDVDPVAAGRCETDRYQPCIRSNRKVRSNKKAWIEGNDSKFDRKVFCQTTYGLAGESVSFEFFARGMLL